MTLRHHPDLASLMSCSAGSMPEPLAAVMATHVSMCPECRVELGRMERIGTVLFNSLPPAEISRPPARGEDEGQATSGRLPDEVIEVLRPTGRKLAWRRLGPGLWFLPIPLSGNGGGRLHLVKAAPGVAMPEHGHTASELTIILDGAYTDEIGTFRVGDVEDLDDSVEHRPVACPRQGCICLTAMQGRSRFKGWLARLIAPLAGF